jgi:hypothetical protein
LWKSAAANWPVGPEIVYVWGDATPFATVHELDAIPDAACDSDAVTVTGCWLVSTAGADAAPPRVVVGACVSMFNVIESTDEDTPELETA